ncbi:MAG: ribonuclease III [Candidatus Nanosyncoccaceae bacterium]|jgi:ribonuclease-3
MDKTPYVDFAKNVLGVEYKDIDVLITALTHRSYLNEHRKSASEHNERLEFLGDAVLELVVTDYLFSNFNEPEGVLTALRSALVRTESIGTAGARLGYEPLLRMSRGEKRGSERARQQIVADAFEAILGSIYLEKGFSEAKRIVDSQILPQLKGILESGSWRDPKSHIQEVMQRVDSTTPSYRVLEEDGPDHDKTFVVGLFNGDELISQGTGSSKQAGQEAAARKALKIYQAKEDEIDETDEKV